MNEPYTSAANAIAGLEDVLGPSAQSKPNLESNRTIPPLWGNQGKPAYLNQKEQVAHRQIAFLKASCCSNVEIAETTGYSVATIGYLVKQPFMQELMLREIHHRGGVALDVLKVAAEEAATELVEIMRTVENQEVKRKACNDILDRNYGKPNQPMSVTKKNADEMSLEEINKRLQELSERRDRQSN